MMSSIVFLLSLLSLTGAKLNYESDTCVRDGSTSNNPNVAVLKSTLYGTSNHYYIGGLFGVHQSTPKVMDCTVNPIRLRGLMNLEAFLWAVKTYGKKIHPEISIGAIGFDSCTRTEQNIENILSFEECSVLYDKIEPRNLLAYVGPDRSSDVVALKSLMASMKKTFVSHSATSPKLSADEFEYLLRSVPTDETDSKILAEILKKENMDYVMAIYQDDDYGRAGLETFKAAYDGCVTFEQAIPLDADDDKLKEIFREVKEKGKDLTKSVVFYATPDIANKFFKAGQAENLLRDIVFFGTSSWGDKSTTISGIDFISLVSISLKTTSELRTAVNDFETHFKSLTLETNKENPWFKKFWEEQANCIADSTCDKTKSLADISVSIETDVYVPFTILAVQSVLKGVKDAAKESCGNSSSVCETMLNSKTSLFDNIARQAVFKDRMLADSYKLYDIHRFLTKEKTFRKIGDYNFGRQTPLVMTEDLSVRSVCANSPCEECGEKLTTAPPTTTPKTTTTTEELMPVDNVYVMVKNGQEMTGVFAHLASKKGADDKMFQTRFDIGHNWIIALGVLAGLGILCVIVFEIYIMYKLMGTRNTHWRTMWLGQLLLFGVFLSYLTLFAYIPVPTKATCGITRFGVGFCYAVLFAVLLVKLMVVLTSKTSESFIPGDTESPNYLKGIYQFLMFVFAVGVQLVIDIQWLITVPPEVVEVTSNSGERVWICNHYTWAASGDVSAANNMPMFVRNEFENHIISLVYVMFLILVNTIVALRAHGIITNHRESVFIGIASGFSIPIFLAWGLVGGLNRDHMYAHEFGDACMAFGLFLVATLVLFAMFLPKVRQLVNMGLEGIYLEDDRDTYYAGSVIMSPPSYKSKQGSVVYVNNGGLYSDPVVIGDPSALHLKASSVYSAPPATYVKKGDQSISGGSKVLRVTGDLTGKQHTIDRRRAASELNYNSMKSRPRSERGTLTRSRSQQDLGAL